MSTPSDILKEHGVRPTRLRIKVLNVLMNTRKSFSFQEMYAYFDRGEDRVTMYRILNDLYHGGVIERVVDIDGINRFVYYPESFGIRPSFRCRHCGSVSCLTPLPEYYIDELKNYWIDDAMLLFSGICDQCLKDNGTKV